MNDRRKSSLKEHELDAKKITDFISLLRIHRSFPSCNPESRINLSSPALNVLMMKLHLLLKTIACIHPNCFFFTACSSFGGESVNTSETSLKPFHPFYPNNVQCLWKITAPQHQIIRFYFKKFDIAQPGDYLEIREEKNTTAFVIGNFTTKTQYRNEIWASSDNNLLINFKSDNDSVADGFEIVWTFVNKSKGILNQTIRSTQIYLSKHM